MTCCVRRLCTESQDARQTYDFFVNPKVSRDKLLKPHIEKTVERVRSSKAEYILAIQDGTRLNYTNHLAKTEIGRIGKQGKTDQYGLIQHNTLCVTDSNEPLGLLDIQHFHYDEFASDVHRHHRNLEEKVTSCWVKASQRVRELLKETGKKVVSLADREGDFFEFLSDLHEHEDLYVVRAKHNRYTGKKHRSRGDKLFDLLGEQENIGKMWTTIYDVKNREIKEISLNLKKLTGVDIAVPNYGRGIDIDKYKPIKINMVMVYNSDYCWLLLTNLAVNTEEEVQRIVKFYKLRWHVEDFHKVLKTGYQVDELYLHSSRASMENALVMSSISACRLYWLIFVGRVEESIRADELFEDYEWKSIYIYFKDEVPEQSPPLMDVIYQIARLGGYKKKKKAKPPGIKTMWLGFQGFTIAARMYHNAILSNKT